MTRSGWSMLVCGWTVLTAETGLAQPATPAGPATPAAIEDESGHVEVEVIEPEELPVQASTDPDFAATPDSSATAGPAAVSTVPTTPRPPQAQPQPQESTLRRIGIGLTVGGGVMDFTSSGARRNSEVGGFWELRAILGSRAPLGFELAYIGAAQSLQNSGGALFRNGFEADVRVNLVLLPMRQVVIPFILVGVGWSLQNLMNVDNPAATGFSDGDNGLVVPVGGGVAFNYRGAYFDGRFTFRPTFFYDGANRLDTWAVGANVGYMF